MQYNENPWLAMSMQRIMRWGHEFPKDEGVGMLTLNLFGEKPYVMGRTHQNCQLPSFLSFLPKPFILPEGGWGSYCLEGKSMGNFEWGRAPSFGISCFTCMNKETPEPYASVDPWVHVFGDLLMILRVAGRFGSGSISILHSREALQQLSSSCVYPSHSTSV